MNRFVRIVGLVVLMLMCNVHTNAEVVDLHVSPDPNTTYPDVPVVFTWTLTPEAELGGDATYYIAYVTDNLAQPWLCSERAPVASCPGGACEYPFYVEPTATILYFDIVAERDYQDIGGSWFCVEETQDHGTRNTCPCHT